MAYFLLSMTLPATVPTLERARELGGDGLPLCGRPFCIGPSVVLALLALECPDWGGVSMRFDVFVLSLMLLAMGGA
jgi:hypothetical protein